MPCRMRTDDLLSLVRGPAAASALPVLMMALLGTHQIQAQQIADGYDNTPPVYSDQFSGGCVNTSVYQGMNPLVCYGVTAPADSRGQCSLNGMRLLRKAGNTCYYCQPINPPIKGIIIPLDQIPQARAQGFTCGVDQANPNCMAVCTRASGNITYVPPRPPGSPAGTGGHYNGWPGPATIPGDPCHAPGGYDYCQNPAGTQPVGCDCSKRPPRPPLAGNVRNTCSVVPDSAWPPLAALERFLDGIAPHYNMTRPGEGLRVMQDSLIALGFGALAQSAAVSLRAAARGVAARLPNPIWSWGTVRGGAFAPLMSVRLPAGVSASAIVRSTPRPLFLQEQAQSCGLACVKMIVDTVKRESLPESWYRALSRGLFGPLDPCAYTPRGGTAMDRLASLINKAGVNANLKRGQNFRDLFDAIKNGYPAIVHLGPNNAGHFVIVDDIVRDAGGNWYVLARDPWNLNLLSAKSRYSFQQMGFRNYAAFSQSDFLGSGGWSGNAIYTRP